VENKDDIILERLKMGDDRSLKDLFDIYYTPLFLVSRQYLFDEFAADTVVCDLFYRLWESRKFLKIEISLKSYLFSSVRNLSLNYLRDNYIDKQISINELDMSSPLLFTSDEYPLGKLIEKELTEKIYEEINTLPPETKQVFILSRFEGLKNPEIAEKLGISINTVKYHMKKALSILREKLKDFLAGWLFF